MEDQTGPLLASGRAADVFDQGDGTVLRRCRVDHDHEHLHGHEARIMTWARDHGISVPKVHHAEGSDMVMDKIIGETMIDDLGNRPWMIVNHARTLAKVQQQINRLTAPDWLRQETTVPDGNALLHLDLHPINIMITADGPVVIDWTNASPGPAEFGAAYSYVMMATFEVDTLLDKVGRQLLLATFVATHGRETVSRYRSEAVAHRLTDDNVTSGERTALKALLT